MKLVKPGIILDPGYVSHPEHVPPRAIVVIGESEYTIEIVGDSIMVRSSMPLAKRFTIDVAASNTLVIGQVK